MCEGKPLNLVKSSLKWLPFRPTLGMKHEILMPDGSNVKCYIGTLVSKLQNVILKNTEGDTKSLFVLIKVFIYIYHFKNKLIKNIKYIFSSNFYSRFGVIFY